MESVRRSTSPHPFSRRSGSMAFRGGMKRLALPALLLISACSGLSPEAKVRNGLEQAGVKPEMASCMAHKMVRKLDTSELRQLASVAKLPREHPGAMSFNELSQRLQTLDNPHIVHVVTRVGLGCAITG
jgi:hypothetical protein